MKKPIDGDLVVYIDSLRTICSCMLYAWSIVRRVTSRLVYLGIQDTSIKERIVNGS